MRQAAATPSPLEDLTFPATDGFTLSGTAYTPLAGAAHGAVLIASATGVRRRYYDRFCRHLAQSGLSALCFDYRGIGNSRPKSLRGFPAQMQDWGERDLPGAIAQARQRWPTLKLALIGHSAGGQIVGLAPNAKELSALLLVAAQSGDWRLWPAKWRPVMFAIWYLGIPAVSHLAGYLPGALGVGGDLPKGVALQWARWCRRVGYLTGGEDAARATGYAALKLPLRALSFEDDSFYAPRRAVAQLLTFYSSATVEHTHLVPGEGGLGPIGHFGFFRSDQRALWDDCAQWLKAQLSA